MNDNNKENKDINQTLHFQKLTPTHTANIKVYEEAINYAFEHKDIQNIAISGAYGAGKSSLLQSYKHKQQKKRFLHISLACFLSAEDKDENTKKSIIEGKILNQLIHQIPTENIPQSKFRLRSDVNKANILCITATICLFVLCCSLIIFQNNIVNYSNALSEGYIKCFLTGLTHSDTILSSSVIIIALACTFIYYLVKLQKTKNVFRKLNLNGNEIEIFEEQDDSYFDKYLNEVLYLFDNIKSDAVVFEDIDRFNKGQIFERLREVNILVNLQRKQRDASNYSTLKFFYLIKDDIFDSKERTKFFDFIIPVVPVIDSSNSYEQISRHLSDAKIYNQFDARFLASLSLYIDDMRLLKNILNEYFIYFSKLNETNLNCNKMLAMIVYKNIFPSDFSSLQLKKGIVYAAFDKKKVLIDDRIDALKIELTTLKTKRAEQSKSKASISREGLQCIQSAFSNYNADLRGRASRIVSGLLEKLPIAAQEAALRFEKEIQEITSAISKVRSYKMKDLLTRENISEVIQSIETQGIHTPNLDLLRFLIREGWIDETYHDYMTYFYPDSISHKDKIFLRRLTDKLGKNYSYEIDNPEKILNSPIVDNESFKEEEILNYTLFSYLLTTESAIYKQYLRTLIDHLRDSQDLDFLTTFFNQNTDSTLFIQTINRHWPDFYSLASEGSYFNHHDMKEFCQQTLTSSSVEVLKLVDNSKQMSTFICRNNSFLQIDNRDIHNTLIAGIELLNVKFEVLDYTSSNPEMFKKAYKRNMYVINFSNIKEILKYILKCENEKDIIHSNFTLIYNKKNSTLFSYIDENIEIYLSEIIENCNGKLMDDQESALYLLNHTKLCAKSKIEYVNHLLCVIENIDEVVNIVEQEVDVGLWTCLMDRRLIKTSYHNILRYFGTYGLNQSLINYINEIEDIDDLNVDVTLDYARFNEAIFKACLIDTPVYIKILKDTQFICEDCNTISLPSDKLPELISNGILLMTQANLNIIRDTYSKEVLDFIKSNFTAYLELQTETNFNISEALSILDWSDITDAEKIQLISLTQEAIPIKNSYSEPLNAHIIENNLAAEDEVKYLACKQNHSFLIQNAIDKHVICNIDDLLERDVHMGEPIIPKVLASEEVSIDSKAKLFSKAIKHKDKGHKTSICSYFNALGLSDLSNIFNGRSSNKRFAVSEMMKHILPALHDKGLIYSFELIEDSKSSYYKILLNKPKNIIEN